MAEMYQHEINSLDLNDNEYRYYHAVSNFEALGLDK